MKGIAIFFGALLIACSLMPSVIFSQPRIDTSVASKLGGGSRLLRLKVKAGEVFHYRTNTKTQISIKNSDDLLKDLMPSLKANDKLLYTSNYFITLTIRGIREDGATDMLLRVDSLHILYDDDVKRRSFTSTNESDREDSIFWDKAVYAGNDFGVIIDTTGNIEDIYGFYNVVNKLDDRYEEDTTQQINQNDAAYSNVQTIARSLFNYLDVDTITAKHVTESSRKENHKVWSTMEFPMQKEYKEQVSGFDERGGKTYAVFTTETTLTPAERVLDEQEYSTTLPNYSYSYKGTDYIDADNGMLAFNKWTEERSFALKIVSKLAEKAGKSFATVQRYKVETVVELLK